MSKGFSCPYPTDDVSVVGGEKIKHRRVAKKIEFLFGLPKSTLFCPAICEMGLANECAFVDRLQFFNKGKNEQ